MVGLLQFIKRLLVVAASCELHTNPPTSIRNESLLSLKSLCKPHANWKWPWTPAQEPFIRISNADDVERWLSYLSRSTKLCNGQSIAFKVISMQNRIIVTNLVLLHHCNYLVEKWNMTLALTFALCYVFLLADFWFPSMSLSCTFRFVFFEILSGAIWIVNTIIKCSQMDCNSIHHAVEVFQRA